MTDNSLTSNSLTTIEREEISGQIGGVDFGPRLIVVIRSPDTMLAWDPGHSYTSGQNRLSYGESGLYLIMNRQHPNWGMSGARRDYKRVGKMSGRFSADRLIPVIEDITTHFGSDAVPAVMASARKRKTLLVDGGGDPPMPSRRQGWAAYQDWLLRSKPI